MASIAFISLICCTNLSLFPSDASAEVVAVQSRALIAGSEACTPVTANNFTPYIYDGALHSFEFTIPDRSYVAISGQVGNTPIPFQFMSRWGELHALRVHVDIPTTPLRGETPLSVTLLSTRGETLCMSIVFMNPLPGGNIPSSKPTTPPATSSSYPPAPSVPTSAEREKKEQKDVPMITPEPSASGVIKGAPALVASIQNAVVAACHDRSSAMRLWIVLLALYAVIVTLAVLIQVSVSRTYSENQRVATIILPLLLLVAFWFSTETCRVSYFAPLAAVIIAIIGVVSLYGNDPLLRAYTERKNMRLPLPSKSSSPMITPPPAEKPKVTETKTEQKSPNV